MRHAYCDITRFHNHGTEFVFPSMQNEIMLLCVRDSRGSTALFSFLEVIQVRPVMQVRQYPPHVGYSLTNSFGFSVRINMILLFGGCKDQT